jgi:regulation of enolase protein 1 (concanavalin A-like superfamily)
VRIPGLPELTWLPGPGAGEASSDATRLTMVAPAGSDWFNDPAGSVRHASAPVLAFPVEGDLQLSARVTVDFASDYDAGVLFVHQGPDDHAKLCFERSPDGEAMVVTVVTRGVSDDSNEPVVDGRSVDLRVSRIGDVFAFHFSLDGERWRLSRLFGLRDPSAPTTLGFLAQSPTGQGCTVEFGRISLTATTLADPRDGS